MILRRRSIPFWLLLMKQAKDVHIVLPAAGQHANMGWRSVFHGTEKTLQRLRQLAVEQGVPLLEEHHMAQPLRWQQREDLAFLAQQYFTVALPARRGSRFI